MDVGVQIAYSIGESPAFAAFEEGDVIPHCVN
jgi:hypothetical protein